MGNRLLCGNPARCRLQSVFGATTLWHSYRTLLAFPVEELGKYVEMKSHQDVSCISDPLQAYFAMGNRFADKLAKRATERNVSPLHTLPWQVAGWYHDQISLLKELPIFLSPGRRNDWMLRSICGKSFGLQYRGLDISVPERRSLDPITWCIEFFNSMHFIVGLAFRCWSISFSQGDVKYLLLSKRESPEHQDRAIHEDACSKKQTVWDMVRFIEGCSCLWRALARNTWSITAWWD